MRHLLLLITAASVLYAQALVLSGPSTPVPVGTKATLTMSLTQSAGKSITAIQFTHTLPGGLALAPGSNPTQPLCSPDQATPVPSKNIYCAGLTASTSAILFGFTPLETPTNTVIPDGSIYTMSFTPTVPGPLSFAFAPSSLFAVSTAGALVPLTAGAPFTVNIATSRCDYNKDNKVDNADTQLVLSSILGLAACPAGFTCSLTNLVAVMLASMPNGSCQL